jgi:hypothetical protein
MEISVAKQLKLWLLGRQNQLEASSELMIGYWKKLILSVKWDSI